MMAIMPMTMTDDDAMMAWQSARGQRVRLTASVVVAAGHDDHDDDGGTDTCMQRPHAVRLAARLRQCGSQVRATQRLAAWRCSAQAQRQLKDIGFAARRRSVGGTARPRSLELRWR
jgi:hypothetical protein